MVTTGLSSHRGLYAAGALFLLAGWLASAAPALAFRPFDGTDAAVAEPHEVEIEFQPAGLLREGSRRSVIAPAVILNYG